MQARIIDISSDNRHLALKRGFLEIRADHKTIGRIPLDDIAAVIAHGHGLTMSATLLVALAERGASFVLCGRNHVPVSYLIGLDGHHRQAAHMDAQNAVSKPLCKRLWQAVIKAKIAHQAAVLRGLGREDKSVSMLIPKVRSGDPENIEAQAARRYWPLAFGKEFRRDRSATGANAMLNYAYTILRAATARAIVAAGLHPGFGLHHKGGGNPMRLADDLIEPFRPLAEAAVLGLLKQGQNHVTAETKPLLAQVAYFDMETSLGVSPAYVCMHRLASSLAQVFLGQSRDLSLPQPLPLVLGQILSGHLKPE